MPASILTESERRGSAGEQIGPVAPNSMNHVIVPGFLRLALEFRLLFRAIGGSSLKIQ
jgi:hypothetical protein